MSARERALTGPRRWWVIGGIIVGIALIGSLFLYRTYQDQSAVLRSDPEILLTRTALRRTALNAGAQVYQSHCAACHGAHGGGDPTLGVPDLTTGRHLYGEGRVAEVEEIARHGIRSLDKRGFNLAAMPAFATAHPYKGEPLPSLTPLQIENLTQYVLAFLGRATDPAAAALGGGLFKNQAGCWDCHGSDARGDPSIGAPSLVVDQWLYGHGSHDDIYRSIARGRAGVSPAFEHRLSAAELRDVAAYVVSLAPSRGAVNDR